MIGEEIRKEHEGEQDAREDASFAEILPDESARFFDAGENEYGDTEEEEPFDADEGKEHRGKEHAEIIRRGRMMKEGHQLEAKEEEEEEREIFRESEVKEKEGNETSGKKNESVPDYRRSKLSEEKEECER
jgi:hypothetical protein